MNHRPIIWSFVLLGMILSAKGAESAAEVEFFEKKIRPVLAESCYDCHSAESKKLKGSLRVDSRAGLLRGGDEGPAIVPGKPGESRLIAAISHRDPDLAMPPKKPKLADAIVQDFERWVLAGAPWPGGDGEAGKVVEFDLEARKRKQAWVWKTPERQTIPTVSDLAWPRSEADFFILARLEAAGLSPAAEINDRLWLRRVYFAITGLPPSREAIQSFLADRNPGARERVVDDLLSSPEFGERWARHWMDLVRYAESRGHESDFLIANAWHYRDYLIRAFNANVPYDQFVMEHVAGDLLPRPRLREGSDGNESVLATGWAFLGEENHSPVDIRQDECERIDNKVDVFSKTFLGLTVACARCHDHKFDPIRAQDYYALSGFVLGSGYRQVRFEAMENNRRMAAELESLRGQYGPKLTRAISEGREAGILKVAESILAARAAVVGESGVSELPKQTRAWMEYLLQVKTNGIGPLGVFAKAALARESENADWFEAVMKSNRVGGVEWNGAGVRMIADFTRNESTSWKADGEAYGTRALTVGEVVFGNSADRPIVALMAYGAARRDLFWKGLKNAPGNENDVGRFAATSRAGQMLRTPTVTLESGKLHYLIKGKTRVYAAVDSHLMNEGPLHAALAKSFDASGGSRWVTHDLTAYAGHRAHIEFGPDGENELEILMVVEAAEAPKWTPVARFYESEQSSSVEEYARDFQAALVAANKKLASGTCGDATGASLANFILQNAGLFGESEEERRLGAEFMAAQNKIATRVKWESRTAVALFDGTGVDENILVRGKPFKPGAPAPRALPTAFEGSKRIERKDSSGRFELARQLIDPANPLVARVFVNRVWHHIFGRGIVASVDNFGELGDRPTHPELLDQLAWQFVHEDRWSVKRLIRKLVLSRTFAMESKSSDASSDEKDPTNALWHRMNVRRLEGEAIRDAVLAVSGRLRPQVGGAPQPLHLTEFLIGRGRPDKSGPLDGDGRRSVYLAMRRNFLPTLQMTFDAPTPFSSVGKRNVTNVPGQSLALMNDPLFHQQARVWQGRLFREVSGDARKRIEWLFESAYGRLPTEKETKSCLESLSAFRGLHEGDEAEAESWVDLCHALLNANEFIYVN